jgi:hypothetical protein
MKASLKLSGLDSFLSSLDGFRTKSLAGAEMGMEAAMAEAEATSKMSAPWTDRTGNARNSIGGYQTKEMDRVVGILSIGVFYGVFLELCNGGKYRTVWPTLEWEAVRLPLWLGKFML